jgi:hypothetical protein
VQILASRHLKTDISFSTSTENQRIKTTFQLKKRNINNVSYIKDSLPWYTIF